MEGGPPPFLVPEYVLVSSLAVFTLPIQLYPPGIREYLAAIHARLYV